MVIIMILKYNVYLCSFISLFFFDYTANMNKTERIRKRLFFNDTKIGK